MCAWINNKTIGLRHILKTLKMIGILSGILFLYGRQSDTKFELCSGRKITYLAVARSYFIWRPSEELLILSCGRLNSYMAATR